MQRLLLMPLPLLLLLLLLRYMCMPLSLLLHCYFVCLSRYRLLSRAEAVSG
jgi:hypothetical protein